MDELISLKLANLDQLPETIGKPNYDRQKQSAGIIHVGLGNFHRAHQSWYLHRLFQQGVDLDWSIIGAGVRPYDANMRDKLLAQDCLSTLIELDPAGKAAEVVGSMIDYLPVQPGNRPLIERMAQADIRIVSLTVTEGGYYIDPATKGFDASHPDIVHDAQNPEHPRSVFGAMIASLRIRRDKGIGPFSGQSCDNLQGNGRILRQTLVSLAELSDPDLARWIDNNCSFPNSMVDCIVPATGEKELALVNEFGIDDKVPVTHENFRQWVIEDNFCAGRPNWDKAGAVFCDDVHDFEAMKIRILNGGHQVIAVPGDIMGIETIAGTMDNPLIRGFFQKVEEEEIAPHVAPVPGTQPADYIKMIDRRFSNREIFDTTRRVAFDGSSRQSGFIIPSVMDGLKAGTSVNGLALVSAFWARYCLGKREDGSTIEPNDPFWSELQPTAQKAKEDPLEWLRMRNIYGDLADNSEFADAFSRWLSLIHQQGCAAALQAYLEG